MVAARDGGWWDELAATLTPEYRDQLDEAWSIFTHGGEKGATFAGPEGIQISLGRGRKAGVTANRSKTIAAMRRRLEAANLRPEQAALYTDEVLGLMANLADEPYLLRYEGSDYEAMAHAMERMQGEEVVRLRTIDQPGGEPHGVVDRVPVPVA